MQISMGKRSSQVTKENIKNLPNQKFRNREFRDSEKFPWLVASSTIYRFHELGVFFYKLLDIKESSVA